MATSTDSIEQLANQDYKYGFVTEIDAEAVPAGLNEEIIRIISDKKGEPEWLLEWRLKAFRFWQTMAEPAWHNVHFPPVDFQNIIYYSAPKQKPKLESLDDLDPEIKATFDKLGIPLEEQKVMSGVAVDAVFDSVSVATTFKGKLAELGIIFCSFSEAVRDHPDLVRKYLGSVVPASDNFYAALNSAVFSDGSFAYIPKGVKLPDGAVDLLPHQRGADRAVRADAAGGRRGGDGELPRRLHGADARREPAPRGGGRAGGARRRDHQVLDGAELVSRATRTARAASTTS